MWAKQSTAATLIVGPILDSTGAEFTTAVIGDLSLSKNGGTLTALAAAATLTHIANGQYTLVLTTGNLDTLGRLQITCNRATFQMPPIGLVVVPAMVFDSLVLGTDVLQGDVTQFGGTAGTFAGGRPQVNTTQFAGQTITAAAGVTIPSLIASTTNITGGTITTVTNLTNAPTTGDFTATMKASITAAVPTASAIATEVDTTLTASHGSGTWQTATGFATPANVSDSTSAILADLTEGVELDSAALRAALGLDAADLDDQLDAILAASGGAGGGGDWSDTEKAQIRYRLGLNGTATAPEDPDGEPIVITPGSGSFTTGYVTCFDQDGTIFPDCTLYQRMIEAPSGDVGYAYDSSQTSVVSASNGVAQFPNLVKGGTYLFFRGKESEGSVLTIPTSAGATYALPSIVGR